MQAKSATRASARGIGCTNTGAMVATVRTSTSASAASTQAPRPNQMRFAAMNPAKGPNAAST